jgi:hypothetical protein
MNKYIVVPVLLLTTSLFSGTLNRKPVVLPNPALLGCRSEACSQLWGKGELPANAVYPRQVMVDVDQKAITAFYDKSVNLEDIEASINQRYAKWLRVKGVVKVWRVENGKFAIYLSKGDHGNEVAFLAFRDLKFQ